MVDPSFVGPGAHTNLRVPFRENEDKSLFYKLYINIRHVNTFTSPLLGFWGLEGACDISFIRPEALTISASYASQ